MSIRKKWGIFLTVLICFKSCPASTPWPILKNFVPNVADYCIIVVGKYLEKQLERHSCYLLYRLGLLPRGTRYRRTTVVVSIRICCSHCMHVTCRTLEARAIRHVTEKRPLPTPHRRAADRVSRITSWMTAPCHPLTACCRDKHWATGLTVLQTNDIKHRHHVVKKTLTMITTFQ